MRREKHTGAHRCWRTQKFPHCPSLSTLFSYHTHGNKMNKLQLLTRTDNGLTSAVYFSRKNSIPTTLVAQWGCRSIRWFRRTVIRKSAAKQMGGDVCFNIKRCKTSGAQSSLLNQDSALSFWKRCLSLQAILLALGVCFNHFCCCVHLPSGKSKWHAMSAIRTDNKMKTKHPTLLSSFRATGGINSPPNTGENIKYSGAGFTPPLKVHSSQSPIPFMTVIQGPNASNILMLKADRRI